MDREKSRGYLLGAIAAISYGLNPLFAKPLYVAGLTVDSVLFYRYLTAVVVLGLMMKFRGHSFGITTKEFFKLTGMGLLISLSSLFLFLSYNYMDTGVASTILFVYPVMVAVIMAVGFHERLGLITIFAIMMALVGVALLCRTSDGTMLSWMGVMMVVLSSLCYAVYIVAVNRSSLSRMDTEKLTFYVLLTGIMVYVVRLHGLTDLQMIPSSAVQTEQLNALHPILLWGCAVGLGVFPTNVSFVTMAGAIRRIGSTPTAILGALEPVTALFFGVLVFEEEFTMQIFVGVLLILAAVTCIIASDTLSVQILRFARHTHINRLPRLLHLRRK